MMNEFNYDRAQLIFKDMTGQDSIEWVNKLWNDFKDDVAFDYDKGSHQYHDFLNDKRNFIWPMGSEVDGEFRFINELSNYSNAQFKLLAGCSLDELVEFIIKNN